MNFQWVMLDFLHRIALGFCSVLALLAMMAVGLRRRNLRTVRPRRR
jgi:hypothetical protein